MKQNKTIQTVIISLMLVLMSLSFVYSISAEDPSIPDYDVSGYVFVDGTKTDDVEITISVAGYDDVTTTSYYNEPFDVHGVYVGHFSAEKGDNVSFVLKDGYNYFYFPNDLTITHDPQYAYYNHNFTIDTSTTSPPDKPSLISSSDGSTISSKSQATLKVSVSDPDGDDMDVSFYDASDDSKIGSTQLKVEDGSTAEVTWTGLNEDTTYSWYAVADDTIKETNSDTWTFTTKEEQNYEPQPPNPTPPDDDDTDDGGQTTGPGEEETEEPPIVPNRNPIAIEFDTESGIKTGSINQEISFYAIGKDVDSPQVNYTIDWDDGNTVYSGFIDNNTRYEKNHTFTSAGIYNPKFEVIDDYNAIDSITIQILIDVHLIDDSENDVDGYLEDEDSSGEYDKFHNEKDGSSSNLEKDGDDYLIDTDGDGEADYRYNPDTGEGSIITDEKDESKESDTPTKKSSPDNTVYYIAGILIVIILLVLFFFLTKKKKE